MFRLFGCDERPVGRFFPNLEPRRGVGASFILSNKPGRSDLRVTVVLLLPTGYIYRIVPSRAFGRQTEVNEKQSEQAMGS